MARSVGSGVRLPRRCCAVNYAPCPCLVAWCSFLRVWPYLPLVPVWPVLIPCPRLPFGILLTGRYAWLRRGALLLRLCRGCGVVCMEPLSCYATVGSIPPVPGDVCLAPSATRSSALSRSAAPLLFEFPIQLIFKFVKINNLTYRRI